jgi:hypothetical protein
MATTKIENNSAEIQRNSADANFSPEFLFSMSASGYHSASGVSVLPTLIIALAMIEERFTTFTTFHLISACVFCRDTPSTDMMAGVDTMAFGVLFKNDLHSIPTLFIGHRQHARDNNTDQHCAYCAMD